MLGYSILLLHWECHGRSWKVMEATTLKIGCSSVGSSSSGDIATKVVPFDSSDPGDCNGVLCVSFRRSYEKLVAHCLNHIPPQLYRLSQNPIQRCYRNETLTAALLAPAAFQWYRSRDHRATTREVVFFSFPKEET